MLPAVLCRFLLLGLCYQFIWAAHPRRTELRFESSVSIPASPFPLSSGDNVTFHLVISHTSKSQVKAVDVLLQLQIPLYIKVLSHKAGDGVPWTSVDKSEPSMIKFKFNVVKLSKSITLSLNADLDPYFSVNRNENYKVALLVDLWYYGEDGPCSRPTSLYNAFHITSRVPVKFLSTTACEKKIEIEASGYSASSESSSAPASKASFASLGVWMTSDSLSADRNQFLRLDLSRLMRITKIATRGQTTPFVAFVRTFHVYYSTNSIEWSVSRENKEIKVFQANTDGKNVAFNFMPSLTYARYLRIVAKSWKKRQALEIEVFGCTVHPKKAVVDYCPIFDFENDIVNWQKTGTAFDNQPTYGDNYEVRKGVSANIQGNAWIATAEDRMEPHLPAGIKKGDAPKGTLTSPKFLIATSKLYFLIGGNSSDANAQLLVNGKSVRKASGDGDEMKEVTWNVKEFHGKEAVLKLTDNTVDEHLNFDALRVDCFLDANAQDITLPSRSAMLNPRTHFFYVCDSSHMRREDSSICRMTSGNTNTWFDIPDVVGLLGVDKSNHKLYAVSQDRHLIASINPSGGEWMYVERSEWNAAKLKGSMVKMITVPWVTTNDDFAAKVLLSFPDGNGDQWRVSSRSIILKPAGFDSWVNIAVWSCQITDDVSDDPCYSEPCENQSNCTVVTRDQYNCSCLPGYTGVNCETDIDECLSITCMNGGSCVHDIDFYFCHCLPGFSGDHCENVLPTCLTSPCLNGGTCTDETPPAFLCSCTSNYKGTYCEIEKDPCLINPCQQNGVCVPENGAYKCVCPYDFTGTKCGTRINTNFEVLATRSITETNKYTVIKARIPTHGESQTENWCKDYLNLCILDHGREPTGFGRSYNHIKEYASCQEKYHSIMDRANILGAKPNEKVAALAQQAGFSDATSTNSFAFNACDGRKCSRLLPESGCDEALSCISRSVPNHVVYTVCIMPDSNFRPTNRKWDVINGVRLLLLGTKTYGAYSKHGTWCKDFEILCDRYGLRAVGNYFDDYGCVENYRAIIHSHVVQSNMRNSMGKSYSFLFKHCSACNRYSYSTSNALHYFYYYSYAFATACSQPQGIGFKVLDDKKLINYNDNDYMTIKVQVSLNGRSNDTNWCKDYQLLCDSYKMLPLGCGDCVWEYYSSSASCPVSSTDAEQMLHTAGFNGANSSNTFIYKTCSSCSNQVVQNECQTNDLFCIDKDNRYRVFYTVCIKADKPESSKQRALQVKVSRSVVHESRSYTVLELNYLPENGQPLLSNWCEEYKALCQSIGGRPLGCGPSYQSDGDVATCGSSYGALMDNDNLLCGNNNELQNIVRKAGFSPSYKNTFMFHKCSSEACAQRLTFSCYSSCQCHPALGCISNQISRSSRTAYTICSGSTGAFDVVETKQSTHEGRDVLVVKARIPSNGRAFSKNWCEDYRTMCYYYGYRPTGCGIDHANDINYASCRVEYQSVMPTDNVYGCPATAKIAFVAKAAGFVDATVGNSFGFTDCKATCVSTLTTGGPFIDLSVTDGLVYTLCETSNSHFNVMSSTKSIYKGGEYLFVKAQVPHNLISKHDTWCTDYQLMCESFGLKPVSQSGVETHSNYATCRKPYGAVTTLRHEANHRDAIMNFGQGFLGYKQMDYDNTFAFGERCDEYCYNNMYEYNIRYSLHHLLGTDVENYGYNVFTVCSSSDSNFHVVSTKEIAHQGEDYLVIMAKLPSHRMSKYENWCRDYERLCRSFKKRPTGCGLSYQWSFKYRSCVDQYQSAMAENDPVGCNSSKDVASIANKAGFSSANSSNSFAFHQCSNECPNKLSDSCPVSLSCLTARWDIVYTVCTDSSSAFEVERVTHMSEGNVPLLFITATLNGVVAKSGDWCTDYQKLCASYASRPVGCYSSDDKDDMSKCTKNYNAVPIQSDLQRCGDDGKDDIFRIKGTIPASPEGHAFKCHKCKKTNCQSSLSDSQCNDALHCLQGKGNEWVYTTCSRASHNFKIISTKSTSYNELEDILIVKVDIPNHGKSLYDNWCEDYTKMCSAYDKVPLACPSRPDYTPESAYRACSEDYNGYMMKYDETDGSTLSCHLNDLAYKIAKAGFNKASRTNTFSLTTCESCSKELQVIHEGSTSYASMSCPPGKECTPLKNPADKLYMLCVKPPNVSTFQVDEIRHVKYKDRKYAVIRVSFPDGQTTSMFSDWCTDYQKVCESISMRPIACGRDHEGLYARRLCRTKYNAVMLHDFNCPNYDQMADVVRGAGYHYDNNRVFSLNSCNECGAYLFSSIGLDRISTTSGFMYSACTHSDSNFEELQKRNVVVEDKSFLVVKAQLPVDMISSHETWCKDYEMMCRSYGLRPLTCSYIADPQTSYDALLLENYCEKLSSIPQQAGFTDATDDNTLIFKSFNKRRCLRKFPSANGPFGRLNSSVAHRQLYALCSNSRTAFEVVARRAWIAGNKRSYLFLQVRIPENGTAKFDSWCADYAELCRENGLRPVTCTGHFCETSYGAVNLNEHVCPRDSMLSFAENAGVSHVNRETNYLFSFSCYSTRCKKVLETHNCTARGKDITHCLDRDVNNGEFTTVCVAPTKRTRFPIIDAKYLEYSGRRYTVIRTQKTHKTSVQSSWCGDYRQLCMTFSQSPLACTAKYSTDPDFHKCQRDFGAVSMESDEQGCPINKFVAELARLVGFARATPQNSFAFQNCNQKYCQQHLPTSESSECSEALYCMNTMGDQEELYTACTDSDSAFDFRSYRFDVSYNSVKYGVVKVHVLKDQQSVHENWCKDYQRLCESFNMEAVQCQSDIELVSDFCTNKYGARRRLQSCLTDAKNIAVKANIGAVSDKMTLVLNGCTSCPTLVTDSCSSTPYCLRPGYLYAICAMRREVYAFRPLQTRFVNYGHRAYLLIHSLLRQQYAPNFRNDYNDLCVSIYGYKPIACGRSARENNNNLGDCLSQYQHSLSHEGNDFTCPVAKTISYLAKKSGFYQARHSNSFGFHQCGAYAYYRSYYGGYKLSDSCYNRLWCLQYNSQRYPYYTMCALPLPSKSLGFHVLERKEFMFLGIKYAAFKLSIGNTGESATDNWCLDYRELCRRYDMVPTGCGAAKKRNADYYKCASTYKSFMSHRNAVGCGNTDAPSSLARRAGLKDATKENTFVFNDCSKCVKKLKDFVCDSALNCLHSSPFNMHAYTLCVERKSGFEYIAKKKTIYGEVEYLVVKSALPVDNKPFYENWCVDYQKLCYSVGAFPVACSLGAGVQDLRRFAEKYGAITVDSLPCPPIAKVLAIVKKAGYSTAKAGNSFAFTGYTSYECSKNLPTLHCTPGLDCLNSREREVFAVCINPTNFAVSDVRTSRYAGNTFTVIQATLPSTGLSKTSSWCEDYATLCRSMKQQPVICPGRAAPSQYEKCRDNYDGYFLFDEYKCSTQTKLLYEIPHRSGFADANFMNTFAFASCDNCKRELSSSKCDSSVNSISNQTVEGRVYAICVKSSKDSSFQILEKREVLTSEVQYEVVKALVSPFGRSKYDTWCMDYERMCASLEMRPVRCSSNGNACPLLHTALVPSQKFDCSNNSALVKFVTDAGFTQATKDNTFIFNACSTTSNCRKTLSENDCDGSINCLKKSSEDRVVYTLCARNSHTSFKYLDSRMHVYSGVTYFVIKAGKYSGESKGVNWCYDYRDMCLAFGKQPVVTGSFNDIYNEDRNQCFAAYNATTTMKQYYHYNHLVDEISMAHTDCPVAYIYCRSCLKTFQHCPFRNCNCDFYYLFCL